MHRQSWVPLAGQRNSWGQRHSRPWQRYKMFILSASSQGSTTNQAMWVAAPGPQNTKGPEKSKLTMCQLACANLTENEFGNMHHQSTSSQHDGFKVGPSLPPHLVFLSWGSPCIKIWLQDLPNCVNMLHIRLIHIDEYRKTYKWTNKMLNNTINH